VKGGGEGGEDRVSGLANNNNKSWELGILDILTNVSYLIKD